MVKTFARSIVDLTAQKGVRFVRALGSPVINVLKYATRRRDGLAPPTSRKSLARNLGSRSALEIGPFFSPLLKGDNVRYFDILDQSALRERAKRIGGLEDDVPKIDFVSPTGDLTIVSSRFDVVISAHVIEHQPDLIQHLKDVSAILKPGGEYWVIVPDRRYSFDYALPESQHASIIEAHKRLDTIHSAENITLHLTKTVHNNALIHWFGWHKKVISKLELAPNIDSELRRAANGEYVDVHAWIFTPSSFKRSLNKLYDEGLISLQVFSVTDTAFGKLEFFSCLRLTQAVDTAGTAPT